MTTRTDTKEKILDLAEALMQEKGFGEFSYAHLSAELNIKNAAVHYHFPSKEDLGKAIIERAGQRFLDWCQQESMQQVTAKERLSAFMDVYYRQNLERGIRLCLVGSSAAAFPALPPGMQQEVLAMTSQILEWLARTLEEGRENWEFNFNGSARAMAGVFLSAISGALQLSRIGGESFYAATVQQLWNQLVVKT
ncbi:TetR/AcrR family transcriptional regulator [Rufibacter psychrotolerans]|uniref:TetR/AcrR family transcriptional regulator n=1 Tax=Rufibacter psychrotolerans TaxID=2812556 RepID=UPI00196752BA|nr:TetR/AcrR family transcriptional regulator [Rufibacter sp. SYSU D00308]